MTSGSRRGRESTTDPRRGVGEVVVPGPAPGSRCAAVGRPARARRSRAASAVRQVAQAVLVELGRARSRRRSPTRSRRVEERVPRPDGRREVARAPLQSGPLDRRSAPSSTARPDRRAGSARGRDQAGRRSPAVPAVTTRRVRRRGSGRRPQVAAEGLARASRSRCRGTRALRPADPLERTRARGRPGRRDELRAPGATVGEAACSRCPSRRASDRTSWSLWRTTSASGSAGPPRRNPRYGPAISQPSTSPWRWMPEQFLLGGAEPGIGHPVPEQPADDRQQVQVAGMVGRGRPVQPVAGDEQRPVEPAAVVGHQPAVGGDEVAEGRQHRRLVGVVRDEQLDLAERIPDPPAEPDEEGDGPGRRRQPGRLGVEADQRRVGPGLAGQIAPVGRDRSGSIGAATCTRPRTPPGPVDLAVDGVGQPLGQVGTARRRRRRPERRRRSPDRPIAVAVSGAGDGPAAPCWSITGPRARAAPAPKLVEQAQG